MKNILIAVSVILVVLAGGSVILTLAGIWFTGICLAEVGS